MVIIPARNEGPRVGDVVRSVQLVLPGHKVVVVVNGTTDDTALQAKNAGAEVITSKAGYANALREGYRHALKDKTTIFVVQMDSDGQHLAQSLPRLIAGLDHFDLVVGARFGGSTVHWVPAYKKAIMGALSWWGSRAIGSKLTDTTSGLQALSMPVVTFLASGAFCEDVADLNVLLKVSLASFKVGEVPVEMRDRLGGESMHGGWRSALYLAQMISLSRKEVRKARLNRR